MEHQLSQLFRDLGLERPIYEVGSKDNYVKYLREVLETKRKPHLPEPGDSICFTTKNPMISALFFDRIHFMPSGGIPEDICFFGGTNDEIQFTLLMLILSLELNSLDIKDKIEPISSRFSKTLFEQFGVVPTWEFSDRYSFANEFSAGNDTIIEGIISKIPLVDESNLDWEQVVEFRNDQDARIKYKRFLQWLNQEVSKKPGNQIVDEIEIKLDDYEWALKKHGFQTVLGELSSMLDAKFLSSTSLAVIGTTIAGGELLGGITGAGLLIGKAAVKIGTLAVDFKDKQRGQNHEIAYIHEVKKQLG